MIPSPGDQDTSDVFTEVSRGVYYQLWLSSRICSRNRAGGGVAQVSNQKAMTGGASATFGALRQGSLENRALNRVADPCRATILSRRAAVLWIGSLSLIGWAAILALAGVIL